jgi:hypothetical protein
MSLLAINQDAKTRKGMKRGYLTGVMYLAPHKLSGRNLCSDASPGCIATCLNTAGRGAFSNVQKARLAKTQRFIRDRTGFMQELSKDVWRLKDKATRLGMIPLVRLNGTSDIPWENVRSKGYTSLMSYYPGLQFYDYTKHYTRMLMFLDHKLPANYHLTFSRSECNESNCLNILSYGGNVAVVFSTVKGQTLPLTWRGYPVIDGDIDDARPTDNFHSSNGVASLKRTGMVIGLRAKGKARRDMTGFVVQV